MVLTTRQYEKRKYVNSCYNLSCSAYQKEKKIQLFLNQYECDYIDYQKKEEKY